MSTSTPSATEYPGPGRMKETSMSSKRKVAVITGASHGMGAALVEAYRDRDYGVVATARSIRPTNDDQILVVPGDITDRKTAERAISEGLGRFGRIDTLINKAGAFVAKPFTQYTEADYAAALGVTPTGCFTSRSSPSQRWRSGIAATSWSGRIEARTGLRMMLTFPRS